VGKIYLKRNNTQQVYIDSKDIYNVTKDSISNKCCSFELSIHQKNMDKMYQNIKQHNRFQQ